MQKLFAIVTTSKRNTAKRIEEVKMSTRAKKQLDEAISKIALSTNQTKQQVMTKLLAKDDWTHFLLSQS